MVDVGVKPETERVAIASGVVTMEPATADSASISTPLRSSARTVAMM